MTFMKQSICFKLVCYKLGVIVISYCFKLVVDLVKFPLGLPPLDLVKLVEHTNQVNLLANDRENITC